MDKVDILLKTKGILENITEEELEERNVFMKVMLGFIDSSLNKKGMTDLDKREADIICMLFTVLTVYFEEKK